VLNQEQRVNENREGDLNRMREVKLFGDKANCEAGEDSGGFVERVLSESGELAG
jgi:hypothetical protein